MTRCKQNSVEQFLQLDLHGGDLGLLEEHLSKCSECRESLDIAVCDATAWQEVTIFLSDEDTDLELVSNLGSQIAGKQETGKQNRSTGKTELETQSAVRQFLKHLDATDDPRMLGRFGGFDIAGVIGAGGMSFVLKGFDAALNRYVAIKVLSPHLATSDAARQRFAREGQAAAAVVHDNVIAIHSVSDSGELPFLVMPYERGNSLQRRLDERGKLELTEILRIGMQAAQGLAAAHAQGLVHRDIKPGNILLTENVERVKLTDFGLARAVDDASLTRTGLIAGTPQYMSPEQARGEAIDQRSDLFSLGSVLYSLCTGNPPFQADTTYGVLLKITESQAESIQRLNPQIPDWFCRLVERLHAKLPQHRYRSAAEVAKDLQQCLGYVQQPQTGAIPSELLKAKPNSGNLRRWLAVTVLAGATLAMLFSQWPAGKTGQLEMESRASEAEQTAIGNRENERPDTEETVNAREVELEQPGEDAAGFEIEASIDELQRQIIDLEEQVLRQDQLDEIGD